MTSYALGSTSRNSWKGTTDLITPARNAFVSEQFLPEPLGQTAARESRIWVQIRISNIEKHLKYWRQGWSDSYGWVIYLPNISTRQNHLSSGLVSKYWANKLPIHSCLISLAFNFKCFYYQILNRAGLCTSALSFANFSNLALIGPILNKMQLFKNLRI